MSEYKDYILTQQEYIDNLPAGEYLNKLSVAHVRTTSYILTFICVTYAYNEILVYSSSSERESVGWKFFGRWIRDIYEICQVNANYQYKLSKEEEAVLKNY